MAEQIGVCSSSITLWENGKKHPNCRHYPRIFEFLGYIPRFLLDEDAHLKATDFGKWIRHRRQLKGLTVNALAQKLQIHSHTVYEWEEHRRWPYARHKEQLLAILEPLEPPSTQDSSK